MNRNKYLFIKLISIFVLLLLLYGCINFDTWENTKHEKRDFNDLGFPIAVFTDSPNNYEFTQATPTPISSSTAEIDGSSYSEQIEPTVGLYEDKTEEIFSQISDSKRLRGQLLNQALKSITFQVPSDWIGDGDNIFVNQPITSMLHVYAFSQDTTLDEVIGEYTQAMSNLYEIDSQQSEYYDNFIGDIDAKSVVFLGRYKNTNSDWSGLTLTFNTGSYTFLFFWDILGNSDSLKEDIIYVVDSITVY